MLEQSMPYSSPFSPAQHNCWERGVFQHVAHLLGTGLYFFLKVMRVIVKNEVREITFGHAVITWNYFLIFHCCKITSFGPLKVRFEVKKQKDMADDGS